jgi:DNA polymerase III subunit epsilon
MIDWLGWFTHKKKLPPYWKAYEIELQENIPWKSPIEEVEFIIFDTETTGLNAINDHILTISGIKVRGNEILLDEAFECVIKREKSGNDESIAIHQLLPEDLHQGVSEIDAIAAWIKFIGNRPLVAHHIGFDLAMLNNLIKKYYPMAIKNIPIDTAMLAIRLEKFGTQKEHLDMKEFSLDALCDRFGVTTFDRHTSSGDAFITSQLWVKLVQLAQKRGIRTLESLVKNSW